jgi:hypothetical protein
MAGVSDLTRLWLTAWWTAASDEAGSDLAAQALPEAAPIVAAYAWRGLFSAAELEVLGGPRSAPTRQLGPRAEEEPAPGSPADGAQVGLRRGSPRAPALFAALDELARRHAGEQIAVHLERFAVELAMRRALSLPIENPSPTSSSSAPSARNLVVDWPARDAPHLRCAFIGLDLDWSPPPPPKIVARFPGGPGSAATSRS